MDVVQTSLSLFQPPPIDKSIQREYWVEFNPTATISESGAIEFNIPGTSLDYINLAKTRLQVTYILTTEDGNPIKDERGDQGQPLDTSDQVAPVNLTLHSIFRQIDLSLNQKVISPDVGVNYPYKAMIDFLLGTTTDMINSQGQAVLFHKDQPEKMEMVTYLGGNPVFTYRAEKTKDGGSITLEGSLYLDFAFGQNRAILNGVAINVKLFQAGNDFRLMRHGVKVYKLKILSAVLKVCHVGLNPSVIVAHNEALKLAPAIYPFWRSDIKSFSVAAGSQTFMTDNIFHGKVPSKLIIGMVSNSAYSGDFSKNPFNFQHMNANYLEVTVDGQPVPNRPLKPNFEEKNYVASYLSLLDSDLNRKKGIIIRMGDYPGGYALYLFDIQSFLSGKIMSSPMKGHLRLSLRYAKALAETINVIVYAKFPEIVRIDQSRNVTMS